LNFNFAINFNQQPDLYIDAATSNLFFWNNIIHDIFWEYGFNEVSGNFQENNWGKGGLGNDAVQANAQDGAGYNNANFATPPDGQRPRMRMYVWNKSSPMRDGDLDNGIIIHEYGHGISNRLTGGPSNVNCLPSGEPGGMGEGWGDWWATALRQRPSYTARTSFPMGAYSNLVGIRKFPYTTDMAVNPETYDYIRRAGYEGVHAKGEVWAGILWEAYWNFVTAHSFVSDWYQGEGGNNRILQDVVDGLKLQPCRPTFVNARDAILQADQVNYGGQHTCLLWRAFAKRGLGEFAQAGGYGDFTVPASCR
jgi:extracellular elastinolytic metalloproteinase